jgi:hypothetical protein
MPLQGRHRRLLDTYKLVPEEKFDGKNDQTKNEYQQADAINAMHVFYKPCFRTVGIRFFNVEIFCDLSKYTHKKNCIVKIQFSRTKSF